MSIDRIAEIKRKIMTRKRGTIKGDEDYNPEVPQVAVRLQNFCDSYLYLFETNVFIFRTALICSIFFSPLTIVGCGIF